MAKKLIHNAGSADQESKSVRKAKAVKYIHLVGEDHFGKDSHVEGKLIGDSVW